MMYDSNMNKEAAALEHGGDWAGFEQEFGRAPLDFSMNVNPLGIPEGVVKAIASAASKADRYPDPMCRRLRCALAEHEGVPADWILCGNGAADIIDRIAVALCKGKTLALVTAPTFSEYREALERRDCDIRSHRLLSEEGFKLNNRSTTDILDDLIRSEPGKEEAFDSKVIFLCEPNNPTGVTSDKEWLEKILRSSGKAGAILVVDECFNGFLDDPQEHTLKGCLRDNPHLIILKAFTKTYGMAGVRLGYCLCSDTKKLEEIKRAGQPWNVSYIAEEAGLAAIEEREHLERARALISSQRSRLKEEMEKLGIEEVFGEANYILFRWPGQDPVEKLRKRGILIRDCSNYECLEKGWYRIAVKTPEENDELIRILNEIICL